VCFFIPELQAKEETDALKQTDDLDWAGKYVDEKAMLLDWAAKTTDTASLAEINWRLARATLNAAELDFLAQRLTVDQVLKLYEEGEAYADKAIKLNPENPRGYFWKSANMGLWGQTKGILDSLFKAGPMNDNLRIALKYDPDFRDAFYVLGELYEKAPGWPLSFGNVEYSVSLGRKSIDLMENDLSAGKIPWRLEGFYTALASHLWARNWDTTRRANTQADWRRWFNEKTDIVEKHFFYEGTITIKNMSDRDEAREIIQKVIAELESVTNRTVGQEKDLNKAREVFATFK
jgi:tetratricopeptide (TPR) repeat protein